MEPIALCGLLIVLFGLWVEIEPAVRAFAKTVYKNRLLSGAVSKSAVQKPVYVSRMPICLAKVFY